MSDEQNETASPLIDPDDIWRLDNCNLPNDREAVREQIGCHAAAKIMWDELKRCGALNESKLPSSIKGRDGWCAYLGELSVNYLIEEWRHVR